MSNNTLRKQAINQEIQDLTKQIEHLYESREMGRKIRARVQWLERGERNTKYFLGLENKRQTNNIITSIQNESGKKVYKADQILKETSRFYTQLYDSSNVHERDIDSFLSKLTVLHELTDEESSQCEGLITEIECRNALDKMSLNKSPGSDGLTVEFYRVFWEDIKLLVINSFNEAFFEKELAETHNYSIIKLLFKKNNREELKNYRPISLANIDYKLLANVLASRLHTVIGKLISPEQTAYIRGRYIGENVRLLLDVIEYTKEKQIAGVALFLDFVKDFDSLEWNFLMKCLKKFKFKDSFCQWIQIIYSQCKASVNVNGYLTQTINMR